MRTEEGDEIIDPGDYDLGEGQRLRVYVMQDEEENLTMWACTHCQEVDGVMNALLVGVIDGQYNLMQSDTGEFALSLTEAGEAAAKALLQRLGGVTEEESNA